MGKCIILLLPVTLKMYEIEMQFSDFFTLGKLGYDQSVTNGRITVVLESGLMASSRQRQSLNELNLLLVK